MEFAEHRDYAPGDDLRHLDWNALARHEKLVVKEFESELERTALIVVDLSSSMEGEKANRARQIALALAWILLRGQDRVALAVLGQPAYHPAVRGVNSWGGLNLWLERPCAGRARLAEQLKSLAARVPGRSSVILISDWLEEDARSALPLLSYHRHQVAALQVLEAEELSPPWSGPLRLVDCENAQEQLQHLDEFARRAYAVALKEHTDELQQACRKRGFLWTRHLCQEDLGQLLTLQLVSEGWLA